MEKSSFARRKKRFFKEVDDFKKWMLVHKGGTVKITEAWLKKQGACSDGMDWFKAFGKSDSAEVMEGLLKDGKRDWANWLIARLNGDRFMDD